MSKCLESTTVLAIAALLRLLLLLRLLVVRAALLLLLVLPAAALEHEGERKDLRCPHCTFQIIPLPNLYFVPLVLLWDRRSGEVASDWGGLLTPAPAAQTKVCKKEEKTHPRGAIFFKEKIRFGTFWQVSLQNVTSVFTNRNA